MSKKMNKTEKLAKGKYYQMFRKFSYGQSPIKTS